MAGKQFTLKLHEDTTSSIVLDSVTIKDIDDTNLSVTTATVVKEDFPGIDTAWTVKVAYPSASIPAGTTTLNALKKVATDAINAKYNPVAEVVSL